ncbi:hypothetical protein SAMN05216243_1616 [Sediminibacillus albus]|uniref:Uncharacterized protein n=1 Tax=Sediminibacillus albus TaxID=407036 RepID=A0A1G8YHB6_9BACI|nr:hypothetical protein SAMN05216243_1616 [Sediminibacillus albus]
MKQWIKTEKTAPVNSSGGETSQRLFNSNIKIIYKSITSLLNWKIRAILNAVLQERQKLLNVET